MNGLLLWAAALMPAATEGLHQKVEEKDGRIRALEKEMAALKELVTKLSTTRN